MARPAAPFVPDPAAARKRRLGERGETIAARHLTRCGMVLLARVATPVAVEQDEPQPREVSGRDLLAALPEPAPVLGEGVGDER